MECSRGRAFCPLWQDAPLKSAWGKAASVRRPLWYERFHAERQVWTFVFTPPDRWQVQLLRFTVSFLLWSAVLRSNRRWRSLCRIHDARLRCHACVKASFSAALAFSDFVSVRLHSVKSVHAQRPPTLLNFSSLRTELPIFHYSATIFPLILPPAYHKSNRPGVFSTWPDSTGFWLAMRAATDAHVVLLPRCTKFRLSKLKQPRVSCVTSPAVKSAGYAPWT